MLKKLRMKDLLPVKWTPVSKGETDGKYMCPITFKTFTNVTQIVAETGRPGVVGGGFQKGGGEGGDVRGGAGYKLNPV
jgi:hypothetical protein